MCPNSLISDRTSKNISAPKGEKLGVSVASQKRPKRLRAIAARASEWKNHLKVNSLDEIDKMVPECANSLGMLIN
jgi:hypothetical protein